MSHKSASKAGQLGYTNVKVFEAGYPAWVKFAGKSQKVEIKAGTEEGSIDLKVFRKIMAQNPTSIMLIDVRDPDEFATGHFKTAVNIPTDLLESRLKNMKIDKPIVFICATGARSGECYYMLQDLRPDVKDGYYVDATVTYNDDGTQTIVASE